MSDRIIINGEEYVKTSLLKTSALKVKPLRWSEEGFTHKAKSYTIQRQGNGFILKYNGKVISGDVDVSLVKAFAIAQKHHEEQILSSLDLGEWKEVK